MLPNRRFIAVDPSLTCSGWAMFSISQEQLLAVGKIRAKKPPLAMSLRLSDLQEQILDFYNRADLNNNDVLICEAPTTIRDPRATLVVEQVRGLFETLARAKGAQVPGRINPRSVQFEVMGLKGKQLKREIVKATALQVANQIFGERLLDLGLGRSGDPLDRHQDIIDAVLLGVYGISKVRQAERTGEALESLFSQNARSNRGRQSNIVSKVLGGSH